MIERCVVAMMLAIGAGSLSAQPAAAPSSRPAGTSTSRRASPSAPAGVSSSRPAAGSTVRPAEATASHPASSPATGPSRPPATSPALPMSALEAQVDRRVRQLAQEFRDSRAKNRQAAQAELLQLHKAFLDALLAHADDTDSEVRARVLDVMEDAITQARVSMMLARLAPAERQNLLAFRVTQPDLFDEAMSSNWQRRAEAVRKIGQLEDPKCLAEPLLILCLEHPAPEVAQAAAQAACGGHYRSDTMVDALGAVLFRTADRDWQRGWYSHEEAMPHVAAIAALRTIATARSTGILLALLLKEPRYDVQRTSALADAVGASNQKRAIPVLMGELGKTNVFSTWSSNNVKMTVAPADPALMALVRLTGQDPGRFKFVFWDNGMPGRGNTLFGFKDEKDRQNAIRLFKEWWDKNKDTPPYRNLEPLALPPIPGKDSPVPGGAAGIMPAS